MDYGSGYFEGATVEKEYDKKVRGQPNIYEKLKCRNIMARDTTPLRSSYWNSALITKTYNESLMFTMFIIFLVFFNL